MSNEISDDDKKRIEKANKYSFYRAMIAFNEGAEYATIYEREQQAALQTENNIYFQERNEAWKQNAQLEAERSEVVNLLKEIDDFFGGEQLYKENSKTYNLILKIKQKLNSLKTK